jgi:hypothetical protein
MANSSELFRTVANCDYLGFWADHTLNAREVARFLDLNKSEVAKVANVASASVRFDQKIPKQVADRLAEIANIAQLVAQYFEGDAPKTALWFRTKNPLFGNISPRDMIRFGRYEKLRRFVTEALGQSAAALQPGESRHAPPRTATT